MNKSSVYFDVQELYYLPQYLPVYNKLRASQAFDCTFIFHKGKFNSVIKKIINDKQLQSLWVENKDEALDIYLKEKPDWIFLGNTFPSLDLIHKHSKTAQLGHGVGPKKSYYSKSDTSTTVRFVESEYRLKRLSEMYPKDKFENVGFCKMDPIINGEEKGINFSKLNLDSSKKTILYAPTFYPSSIEKFALDFPESFNDFNIIIKPHFFSMSKKKYKGQRKLINHWSSFENVYVAKVEDYNLAPFLYSCDLMISDASSAIIEFSALNKPVIWCKFLKLRWNYRGLFSYRFKKRMDKDYEDFSKIAYGVDSYNDMIDLTKLLINEDHYLSNESKNYLKKLAGILDGKASERIVTFLLKNT